MSKQPNRKEFKKESTYITELICAFIFLAFLVWSFVGTCFYTYQDIEDIVNSNPESYYRYSEGLFTINLAKTYGKPGMIIVICLGFIYSLTQITKLTQEYGRFLHKKRMYKNGLIQDIGDIYCDDYQPKMHFKRLKKWLTEYGLALFWFVFILGFVRTCQAGVADRERKQTKKIEQIQPSFRAIYENVERQLHCLSRHHKITIEKINIHSLKKNKNSQK